MSTTAQEVYELSLAIIDEILDNGTISVNDTKSYSAKAPRLITMGQNELLSSSDLYSKFELSCKPIPNMLGICFDIQEHIDTDKSYEVAGQARAYSIEADGEATVYIEDYTSQWNTLMIVNVPNTVTSLTNYTGIVTPTPNATKSRIRFGGNFYYKYTNYALFSYPLKASQVPKYAPWVKVTMPLDFKSLDSVVTEYPQRQYTKDSDSKWEGNKDYYINYYYEGKVRIIYKPVPIPITSLSQTLQIDDITATTVLTYYLAYNFILQEDDDISRILRDKYLQQKSLNSVKGPVSISQIVDVYNIGGGMNG